jgi:uncharacterized protein involved in exopolysaccharide biosynthesis
MATQRDDDAIDLKPYLAAAWRDKLLILLVAALGAGIGIGYTMVAAPIYRASAVLFLPLPDSGNPMAAIGLTDPLQVLRGVVESQTARRYVSQRTGLTPRQVSEMVTVTPMRFENQLAIAASHESPDLALNVTKLNVEALQDVTTQTSLSMAARQAQLLESAVEQAEQNVAEAEALILAFQKRARTSPDPSTPLSANGYARQLEQVTYDLGRLREQIRVKRQEAAHRARPATELPTGIPGAEKWREQLTDLQHELNVALTTHGPEAPQVVSKRREIEVTRQQLEQEVSKYLASVQQGVDPDLANLEAQRMVLEWQEGHLRLMKEAAPGEAVEYQGLLREAAQRAELLKNVRQRYEQARLDAEVDRVRWSVLVEPYLDDRPVNKRPGRNGVIGLFLGGMVGLMLSATRHGRRRSRLQAEPDEA